MTPRVLKFSFEQKVKIWRANFYHFYKSKAKGYAL